MQDRLKYDLLEEVGNLTMPVLLIVGENDPSVPLKHQKVLFDALLKRKELHIIKNAPHTFWQKDHLDEIKSILDKWIKIPELIFPHFITNDSFIFQILANKQGIKFFVFCFY